MQSLDRPTVFVVITIFIMLCVLFSISFYFYRHRVRRHANAILQSYYESAILSFEEFANGKQVSPAMYQAVSEAAKMRTTQTDSLEIMNEIQKTYGIFIPDPVIEKVLFSYNLNKLVAEYEKYLKSHTPIQQIEVMIQEAYNLKYSKPRKLFMKYLVANHNRYDLQRYFPQIMNKLKEGITITQVIDYIQQDLQIDMPETELYNSLNQMVYGEAMREGEIIAEKFSRNQVGSITEALTELNRKYLNYGFNVNITRSDVDELYNIEVARKTQAIEDFENLVQELSQDLSEKRFALTDKLNRQEETFDAYKTKSYEQKEVYDEKIKRLENEMSKMTVELMEYKEAEKRRIENEMNRVLSELREKTTQITTNEEPKNETN